MCEHCKADEQQERKKNQNDDNIFTCAELRTAELMILTYLQTFF